MLLKTIAESDAVIVAAPAYFLSVNSILKRFLDRGLAFYSYTELLWGKPAIGVGVAGIKGKEGATLLGIENFIRLMLFENKQSCMVYGALPGDAREFCRVCARPCEGGQPKPLGGLSL